MGISTLAMVSLYWNNPPEVIMFYQMNVAIIWEYEMILPIIQITYRVYFDELCNQTWFDIL